MKSLLTFCAIILVHTSYTQSLAWAKQFKGQGINYGTDMAIDAAGNVYVTGYLNGTVDMDPGPGVYNLSQPTGGGTYIAKLDANGNLIWARNFPSNNVLSYGIALDAAGNVYTTGFFQVYADFDPGPGNYTLTVPTGMGSHVFVSKLDNNGNFVWAKQIGGNNNYYARGLDIKIDANSNIIVTGNFVGTADFDPGPAVQNMYSNVRDDAYVLKLDNNGNYLWAKQFSGPSYEYANAVSTDAAGNVYVTGSFSATTDFDPSPTGVYNLVVSGTNGDPYVAKLDANGGFIWAKQISGNAFSEGKAIQTDASGSIYIAGNFYGTADFDPGTGTFPMTATNLGMFFMKLDGTGNFTWAKSLDGPDGDALMGMTLDNSSNLMLTGYFKQTVDFDPNPGTSNLTSAGETDIYIARYTSNGNLLTARQIGSGGGDMGYAATTDLNGNIYATGAFSQTVDFDPTAAVYNLISGGNNFNTYVLKLSRCVNVTSSNITASVCNSYTLNNQVYTSSGTYTQVLQNTTGCDSMITLQLTIGGSVNMATATACSSYSWEGHTYTTSGLYTVQYTDRTGCDSIRKLNLTIKNPVNTNISTSVCEGQNYLGHTTSGTYIDTFVAANGCDSIRTLALIIKPRLRTSVQAVICQGQTYEGYATTGTYTNTYVATNGCDSIRTLTLTVNPHKQIIINAAICEGQNYYAAGAAQTISGEYIDTLHTFLGCDSIIITRLTVSAKPKPDLGPDRSICAGSSVTFNPGSFPSYQWQDGSTGATISTSTAGTYWVKVTNGNCMATDSVKIIAVNPLPANFLKQQDSMCSYDKLILKANNSYKTYVWSDGSTQSTTTVSSPGKYVLQVSDANNCIGKDTVSIFIKECISGVYLPTAFTPNGDGKNDWFKAMVYGKTVNFILQVYDRYGRLIFETKDPSGAWNGNINGTPSSTAVFVWQCNYQLENQPPARQKGTVTLIR